MSWMTPLGDSRVASDGLDTAGTSVPEDVLDPVVPLLHPDQAETATDRQADARLPFCQSGSRGQPPRSRGGDTGGCLG